MRLLIVDDEPLILGGLVKVVKDAAPLGTEVREAGNAFEALEVMKGYMPDVTVTDLHMPETPGTLRYKGAGEIPRNAKVQAVFVEIPRNRWFGCKSPTAP
ncbi:response regulator, partial [Paenibacillus macerans]|uniref:response regulator transcription factor n=1 Tax=Paenibacillus macerans TaxID=44252 RepID=UPI002DBCFB5E